ncbi:MAG: glycosyltransferase family 4 protein [Armatimonadota bacterium]
MVVNPLRVLEMITSARIGGAEVYVADLCRELPELGAKVELFSPAGRPFVSYAAERGISATTWKTHGKFDPVTVFKLARLIKQHNIDVVHTHLSTASLLGAWAARSAGRPSVAHVHGLNTATCFKYSTAVIAVSHAVKKHLCAQGLREEKITVVHNGIDPGKFTPMSADQAKRELGYNPGAPVVGVFGRLSPEKGQRTAIEAMFILLKSQPRTRLMIVGDGKDRDDLRLSVDALGIAGSVDFVGFVRDIRQHMSACDIVIAPSLKEGFGLAAIEAMALKRPVVASSIGGLPEIVVPEQTGLLVPPNDPQALAKALEQLLEHSDTAHDMGERGRMRMEECFDLRKQIGLVLEVLKATQHPTPDA